MQCDLFFSAHSIFSNQISIDWIFFLSLCMQTWTQTMKSVCVCVLQNADTWIVCGENESEFPLCGKYLWSLVECDLLSIHVYSTNVTLYVNEYEIGNWICSSASIENNQYATAISFQQLAIHNNFEPIVDTTAAVQTVFLYHLSLSHAHRALSYWLFCFDLMMIGNNNSVHCTFRHDTVTTFNVIIACMIARQSQDFSAFVLSPYFLCMLSSSPSPSPLVLTRSLSTSISFLLISFVIRKGKKTQKRFWWKVNKISFNNSYTFKIISDALRRGFKPVWKSFWFEKCRNRRFVCVISALWLWALHLFSDIVMCARFNCNVFAINF